VWATPERRQFPVFRGPFSAAADGPEQVPAKQCVAVVAWRGLERFAVRDVDWKGGTVRRISGVPRSAAGAAAVCMALGLAGCAAPEPPRGQPLLTVGSERSLSSSKTDPLTARRTVPSTATPATTTTTATESEVSMPWTLRGISGDERTLYLEYVEGGGCVDPVGLLVQEGATFVAITSVGKDSRAPGDTACAAYLLQAQGTVRLAQPLGTRRLVHPGVSPGW
jgi:hypothetical protein